MRISHKAEHFHAAHVLPVHALPQFIFTDRNQAKMAFCWVWSKLNSTVMDRSIELNTVILPKTRISHFSIYGKNCEGKETRRIPG